MPCWYSRLLGKVLEKRPLYWLTHPLPAWLYRKPQI